MKKSLIKEINAAIGLTLLVVAVIFGAAFLPYQHRQKEIALQEYLFLLRTFKKSEEGTLLEYLFEGKQVELALQLKRLGKTQGIRALAIYDANGQRLADTPEESTPLQLEASQQAQIVQNLEGISTPAEWRNESALFYLAPLRVVDETLGYLQIVYSTEELAQRQRTTFIFLVLLLLSLIMTSLLLLNLFLRRLVNHPIQKLVQTVEEVEKGNLAARAVQMREDEIGHLNQSFNQMVSRLQGSFAEIEKQNLELKELDKLKDEFLANVSHEIRTPLHAIIGFSEGMLEDANSHISADQKKYLEMILEGGRSLNTLVGRLLDFSRMKAGKLELQREALSVKKIMTELWPFMHTFAGNKPIQFIDTIPEDLPSVLADRGCLQQIFLNLLENAVKFTEQGTISLAAEESGAMLKLTVTDTGIGVAPEQMEVIFDEFRQGDGSTRRKYGGTGLGLAIVRHLVRLHGGEVWVKSESGKGSSFHFTLPKAS